MNKYNWDINKIKVLVLESISLSEVLRKINIPIQGNNSTTLKNILNLNNIDYSHFTGRAKKYNNKYILAEEYFTNHKQIKSAKLKDKLLKEHLLENKCAICGLTEWQDKPIILQLHHIDGNNKNNDLSNLQLLCPNCHSQTDNYCGNANKNTTKYYCKSCGKEITKRATYCSVCASRNRRKVERPDLNIIINDYIEFKSFVTIGKKYNTSDNVVKKWFKSYNIPYKKQELIEYINNEYNIVL